MTIEDMENRLKNSLPDCEVAILDLTGGGNHFEVRISSEQINALSRIEQHRYIMKVFDEELKSGEIHALTIKALSL